MIRSGVRDSLILLVVVIACVLAINTAFSWLLLYAVSAVWAASPVEPTLTNSFWLAIIFSVMKAFFVSSPEYKKN